MKDKRRLLLITGIFLSLSVVVGVSYAFWSISSGQENANVVGTDCLKLELVNESEAIALEYAYPLSQEDGLKTEPYTFTIKNTCNTLIDFSINLESLNINDRMDSKYIAVSIDDEEITTLNEFNEAQITYKGDDYEAVESHSILTSFLDSYEESSHTLRLWIDEDADNESMNKNFFSKVVINATPNEVLATAPIVKLSNYDYSNNEITDLTITNNYAYVTEAKITCEGEKSSCYINTTKEIDVSGEVIASCGSEKQPGICTNLTDADTIDANVWYKTSTNAILRPIDGEKEEINIKVLSCVGVDCSEEKEVTLVKQDKTAPEIKIDNIESDIKGATIKTTITDGESGISSTACKYGLSEDNLTNDGVMSEGTCTLSNFTSNTTYYYMIEAINNLGNSKKTTGTITTDEVLTAPILTGGSEEFSDSQTITIAVAGTADSGVKEYEYYISQTSETPSSDVTPTGTTNNAVLVTEEGINYVFYRTVSNKGNKSSWSDAEVSNVYYEASSIEYHNSNDTSITNVQNAIEAIKNIGS